MEEKFVNALEKIKNNFIDYKSYYANLYSDDDAFSQAKIRLRNQIEYLESWVFIESFLDTTIDYMSYYNRIDAFRNEMIDIEKHMVY